MARDKKSFVMHVDTLDVFHALTVEQAGKLIRAIASFQQGHEVELDPITEALFIPFKAQFVRDNERYERTCKARADAGSLGGKAKQANIAIASKSKQKVAKVAKGSKSKQKVANVAKLAKLADSDSDSDSDSKSNIESESERGVVSETLSPSPPGDSSLVDDHPPDEPVRRKFRMSESWEPDPEIWRVVALCFGIPPPTPEQISEFRNYWVDETRIATDRQWCQSLVTRLRKQKRGSENGNGTGKHDLALDDEDDTSWLRAVGPGFDRPN